MSFSYLYDDQTIQKKFRWYLQTCWSTIELLHSHSLSVLLTATLLLKGVSEEDGKLACALIWACLSLEHRNWKKPLSWFQVFIELFPRCEILGCMKWEFCQLILTHWTNKCFQSCTSHYQPLDSWRTSVLVSTCFRQTQRQSKTELSGTLILTKHLMTLKWMTANLLLNLPRERACDFFLLCVLV